MAFKLADNVLETSTTSGTVTLVLNGNVDSYASFTDRMNGGDTCFYVLWVAADPTKYEVGSGTFLTGADRLERNTVFDSSTTPTPGEKEDFGGATINVGIALPGAVVESLLDPSAGAGILALQSATGPEQQPLYAQHTFGDGNHITWSNPDGDGGAPALVDSLLDTRFARIDESTTFTGSVEFLQALFVRDNPIFINNESPINGRRIDDSYTSMLRMSASDIIVLGNSSSDVLLKVDTVDGLKTNINSGPEFIVWHEGNLFNPDFDFTAQRNIASVGHYTFPGGLIMQWGSLNCPDDTTSTETFDIPFPNALFSVAMTHSSDNIDASNQFGMTLHTETTTGFKVTTANNSGGGEKAWIAVGN